MKAITTSGILAGLFVALTLSSVAFAAAKSVTITTLDWPLIPAQLA